MKYDIRRMELTFSEQLSQIEKEIQSITQELAVMDANNSFECQLIDLHLLRLENLVSEIDSIVEKRCRRFRHLSVVNG